jgi:hypothetical protein
VIACAGGLVIFVTGDRAITLADAGTLKPVFEAVPLGRREIDTDFSIV